MAIDPYSPCPCGSGKKVKWCCKDLAKEVAQIDELTDAGQFSQALQLIDRCLSKNPRHSWLRLTKATCLASKGQHAAAREELKRLVSDEPKFKEAWSMYVLIAGLGPDGDLSILQDALDALADSSGDCLDFMTPVLAFVEQRSQLSEQMPSFPLLAYSRLALSLATHLLPAGEQTGQSQGQPADKEEKLSKLDPDQRVDVAKLFREAEKQAKKGKDDSAKLCLLLLEEILELEHYPLEPIWLRAHWRLARPPQGLADEELSNSWHEALRLSAQGRWRRAAELFGQLAERQPQIAELWWNKGLCLARYGNLQQGAEAIRRYAELVDDDADALDAEALAISLLEEVDPTLLTKKAYDFKIVSRARMIERLADSPRVQKSDRPDGSHCWVLLEGPQQSEAGDSDGQQPIQFMSGIIDVSQDTAHLVPLGDNSEEMRRAFLEIVGDSVDLNSEQSYEIDSPVVSAKFEKVPAARSALGGVIERRRKLFARHRADYERGWVDAPFNYLDGKTPREAVAEPGLRRRVRAAVWFVEHRFFAAGEQPPALREQLGLEPEPSWHLNGQAIEDIPPSRLPLLCLEELDKDSLTRIIDLSQRFSLPEVGKRASLVLLRKAEEGEKGIDVSFMLRRALACVSGAEEAEELRKRAKRIAGDDLEEVMDIELAYLFALAALDRQEDVLKHVAYLYGFTKELGGEHQARFLQILLELGLARAVPLEGEPGRARLDFSPALAVVERHLDRVSLGELEAKKFGARVWTPDGQRSAAPSGPGDKPKIWTPDS